MTIIAGDIMELNPQTGILIGLAIIILTLMWRSSRRRAKRATVDGRTSRHAARHAVRLERQASDDINELMVRLEELSREICGQIDIRFAKLENVLNEADRKLAALREAQANASAPGLAPKAVAATAPADARPPTPTPDATHGRIHELAEKGVAAMDIARQVEMTVGEVDLILSLERSRRHAASQQPTPAPAAQSRPAARTAKKKKAPAKRRTTRKKPHGPTLDEKA